MTSLFIYFVFIWVVWEILCSDHCFLLTVNRNLILQFNSHLRLYMEISRFPEVWISLKCTQCMKHLIKVTGLGVHTAVPAWEVRRGGRGLLIIGSLVWTGIVSYSDASHDARVMITFSCETAACSHSYLIRSPRLRSPHIDPIDFKILFWSFFWLFCLTVFCFSVKLSVSPPLS